MKASRKIIVLMVMFVLGLGLVACAGPDATSGAAQAVEAYFKALVEKDQNRMINQSCSTWEEQARNEYNSFAAVELKLQDLKCQVSGQQANSTLVTCTGKIIASYGAEKLEIDVAERTYQAVQEAGEWRMCGYGQ